MLRESIRHVAFIRIAYGAAAITTSIIIIKTLYERSRIVERRSSSESDTDEETKGSLTLLERLPIKTVESFFFSTSERVRAIATDKKEGFQSALHRHIIFYLDKALDSFGEKLKEKIKDDDMPFFLQTGVDDVVDNLMPQLKLKIFRKTNYYLIPYISYNQRDKNLYITSTQTSIPDEDVSLSIFGRLRAFVLYHLFPCDKSIWKCFKDPYWHLFTCIGILPVIGQAWWLYLFIVKDKTDEHLLSQFIIAFKSAHFLTLGVFCCIYGIIKYVKCTIANDFDNLCKSDGPSVDIWDAVFFFIQIFLAYASFCFLPYSNRPLPKHQQRHFSLVKKELGGKKLDLCRGGYLYKFFGYETMCIIVVFALGILLLFSDFEEWQMKALLYWLRTAYGLSSLPFVLFKIPMVSDLLTQTHKMGYNSFGQSTSSSIVQEKN